MSLLKLSKVTGVPYEDLRAYNPHLRSDHTPGEVAIYRIWVTDDMKLKIEAQGSHLAEYRLKGKKYYSSSEQDRTTDPPLFHVVKRGQSLASIAKTYGTSPKKLKKINNISHSKIRPGTRLRLRLDDDDDTADSTELSQNDRSNREVPRHYKVRKGDSLVSVSKQFGVTIVALKKKNRLHRNHLVAGEVLKIDLTR